MKNLKSEPTILLIGLGNSGRGDDGLGWEFVERIISHGYDFMDCEFRYQLQVEDAERISKYDVVVFVDASHEKLSGGFQLCRCTAVNHYFSTHAQAPGAIVYLANSLYLKFPKAYTLAISGKDWELQISLSREAKNNLDAAISFFVEQFLPTALPKMAFS